MTNTPRTDKLEREISVDDGSWSKESIIKLLLFTMREWEGAIAVYIHDTTPAHQDNNRKRLAEIGTCPTCQGSRMTTGWYPSYNNPDNAGGDPPAEPCPDCNHG